MLEVTQPGAYGVEGGSELLAPGVQSAWLEYEGGCTWRMINPAACKVVTLSGLPASLKAGSSISFLYRVSERGITRILHRYEEVKVLQVKDSKAWLKLEENTYFVIQL